MSAVASFFIGLYQGVAATPQLVLDHPLPVLGLVTVGLVLAGGLVYAWKRLTRDD